MRFSIAIGGALFLLSACTKQEPALYASSANEGSYAERYPAMLAALRTAHGESEQQVHAIVAEMPKFPDELREPAWADVRVVVEEADAAGKGADYAAGMGEAESVRRFYGEERDVLRQKVGGSADHAAKEKLCDVELYGPVGGALDRAIDQQLEERLHARSVAHRAIEDHEDALGKPNLEKLEKQADRIALASYLVHVKLPATARELDARVADASGVKKTLERTEEEASAVQADPQASKAKKQTAEKRATAARTARASLDSEVSQAKQLGTEAEKRAKAALDEYEKALDALEDALEARAKAQAEQKPAPK